MHFSYLILYCYIIIKLLTINIELRHMIVSITPSLHARTITHPNKLQRRIVDGTLARVEALEFRQFIKPNMGEREHRIYQFRFTSTC
ncbi:hypothetical protein Hanom_Chr08g00750661 [Helianthus anomalus]